MRDKTTHTRSMFNYFQRKSYSGDLLTEKINHRFEVERILREFNYTSWSGSGDFYWMERDCNFNILMDEEKHIKGINLVAIQVLGV